jgi:uncharacterized protein (TIGR00369 family)
VPAEPPAAVPLDRTLDATLGFEVVEMGEESARARFTVADKHKQPFGLVHGGVFAAIAESLCSGATFAGVAADGMLAQGMSNQTNFLRPILAGTVDAVATRRHRGRTTWVWEVDIIDEQGRLCALSRVTIAVRPRPA